MEQSPPRAPSNRKVRAAGLSVALLVAFGLVLLAVSMEVSSTPGFCGSCHIMEPYFDSWETSSHDEVRCVDCHIPPGVTAEFRKKYEALSMVVRYFTGTYGTNPWAEIDDSSCLTCHERRLLVGQELYHGILFDHAPHLTQMRRGKKLRCTSCHSQIVQGSHISVTSSTCVLCHFKGQELNQGTARCTLCHEVPTGTIQHAEFRFDHGDVVRFAMDCQGCHAGSVRGDGGVPRERCLTCHSEPARLSQIDNIDLLHQKHVAEHKVDCTNCHLEIQHGVQVELETTAPSCGSCHRMGHSPQQQLYAGIGGVGVDPMPSAMFLAGVRCEGCHLELPGRHQEVLKADDIACMTCHGPRYRKFYYQWKTGIDERTRAMGSLLGQSESLFRKAALQTFEDSVHNYQLVQRGFGIHNVSYSYRLLDKALDLLNQARSELGATPFPKPWPTPPYTSACFDCHQGIENQRGRAPGPSFGHTAHVVRAGIDCETCHLPHEGRTGRAHLRFGSQGCSTCHHSEQALECKACHESVFAGYLPSEIGSFSHQLHVEELESDCLDCHQQQPGGAFARLKEICADCH